MMAAYQQSAARSPISIWLVEDNPLFRRTMTDILEEADGLHCTNTFESCEDALETLNQEFAPDIVLMDIALPGISGIEGLKRIRLKSPATQIIMLTIHEDNDTIFEAICAGASGYLLKSARADKIVEEIEEIRRGGAPMSAQIARRVLNMFSQLVTPSYDYDLTDRECEILGLLVDGLSKNAIAEHLHLSPYTVETHIKNTYAKLHVHSRSDAVAKALKERLIT